MRLGFLLRRRASLWILAPPLSGLMLVGTYIKAMEDETARIMKTFPNEFLNCG